MASASASTWSGSIPEWLARVKAPKLNAEMFAYQQADWNETFTAWGIVYVLLNVGIACLYILIGILNLLAHLQLFAVIVLVVYAAFQIAFAFFVAHITWFCVVKQQGCCGKIGYVAWGFVLVFAGFGPACALGTGTNLIFALNLVPIFFMVRSLFKLFVSATGPDVRAPQLQGVV
eukprot:TRINITY_DN27732_c0_g1_i1.p1 TRINITY_DN27732_c0_g1~~TRINITY_DN27732_c0_g1_i1.p1  ORF type:complete len:175 (+),score=26.42 TRINITY_DN27732_c0_g1_i1:61-585(+)